MSRWIAAFLCALAAPQGAQAQEAFPARMVHVMVPFTPGTGATGNIGAD